MMSLMFFSLRVGGSFADVGDVATVADVAAFHVAVEHVASAFAAEALSPDVDQSVGIVSHCSVLALCAELAYGFGRLQSSEARAIEDSHSAGIALVVASKSCGLAPFLHAENTCHYFTVFLRELRCIVHDLLLI
jgi:hypothetical protein